ncbi:MAG: AAA family ATPase [Candidatus Binatia bacterium]
MISFGEFQLDRRTRRLRRRGSERPLRAKSSAVLLYLAEHPNRLVTHAELQRAVWPGTAVSPSVLRVSISEIRAALGAEADRFLTTVPRRGYRFSGETGAATPIFVGRDAEQAGLHEALARACSGRRQVVLVAGEAGAGKTALLDQFLEVLRADGVRCARGQALELHGGEGCAAILDLLSRLCDEAGGDEVVSELARRAPGWLLQLTGRVDDATAERLRSRATAPSWEGRLLELGEAVEALAAERPLVLVLEDLQWSDASTIDALAQLTRRTARAQLLVVASYRPEGLADDHPFLATRQHLLESGRCAETRLGRLPVEQVGAWLALRLAPQPLGEGVARALYDTSGGHPLRLAAAVDRLLDQHRLVVRDDAWQLDGPGVGTGGDHAEAQIGSEPPGDAFDPPGRPAERRQLTVLSCALVGASVLARQLDPEDLRGVVRAVQESASAVIGRWEGYVAQYLVDGLLAYFCYPQAHEDDAERAVRAGLEMLAALQSVNESLEREYGIRPAVRIGIHTGEVVIGEAGGGATRGMIALGDVPYLAGRARNAAAPDTLVVTSATQRLVTETFVVEDAGAQVVEDRREPLALIRVVSASQWRGRLAVAPGRLTSFAGREAELALLSGHWEAARQGAGRSVLVLGEAGIGKSRLALQLRESLASVPHTWIETGATPYTTRTPFHPVIALVAEALGLRDDDSADEKLEKLERGLAELASPEAVALTADLLGLASPTRLELSPELHRRRTIELLARWLLAISATRPTVLLVEDLQWCDPSSLELLGHLVAGSVTEPLLVVLTARAEFTAPWPASEHVTTLTLARLSEHETRDVVLALAPEALPLSTVDALVSRSDGVPLYVQELTRSVLEPDTTRSVDAIPATLADALMGRLDRLSTAKDLVQRAAVLGREFSYSLLATVVDRDDAALRQDLTRLVEAGILFARGEPPDATYVFKHALIEEAAYQTLLKRKRQRLHARVGAVLETRFPERVASEPEVIARHYEQAGLCAPAIAYYQRAGERAAERSANEEAIGHLRRALALLVTLPVDRERDQQELRLQMAIATPLGASGGFSHPDCATAHARARALATRIGESPELARVLVGLATAYFVQGDLATGEAIGRDALAAAERTGDSLDLLLAHVVAGFPHFYRGSFARAAEHYGKAVALYDPREHASFARTLGWDRGVNAHAYLAWCHLYLGHHDRALALSDAAVGLARNLDHPLTLANVLLHVAIHHLERREPDRALPLSEELVELAAPLGFPMFEGVGRFLRGCARADAGDLEKGIAEMEHALGELAKVAVGIGAPGFLVLFAERLRRVGRHDDALGIVAIGLMRAESQGAHWGDAELHRVHARTLLDRGDTEEEAEARLAQSLEIARQQENNLFALRTAMDLARLRQRRGQRDEARALLAPLLASFSEGHELQDLRDAAALLDEVG